MEPVYAPMPGYRINEYRIVLAPPVELWQRIAKLREEFGEKYKSPVARQARPHISLVHFQTWGLMEEKILQRLQHLSLGFRPFKVELKDYGSFPTHSLFIHVTSREPVKELVTQLKEAQRLMKLNNENKPHFLDEPHIPIASRLKPWQYEQGWLEYRHRQFTGRFIADNMLLLSRPAGSKSAFQVVRRFEFMNLPVATKQGSLFG